MADQQSQTSSCFLGMNRTELLVVLVVVAALVAILIPNIQRAREASRKMQSTNNLKQLALAMLNYHDIYKRMPPGAYAVSNGDGHLGWTYLIHPFMEASSLYESIDRDSSWDSELNRQRFRTTLPYYLNPSANEVITREGFPVTHYMANPAFSHLNNSRSLDDATQGTAHAWLAGEIAGNYQPWGYPFNWRELTSPLNASLSSFGRPTGDGTLLVMADGSVQFLDNEVDSKLLATLTSNPPLPSAELTRVFERTFEVVARSEGYRWEWLKLDDEGLSTLGVSALVSPAGRVEFLELEHRGKVFGRDVELRDVYTSVEWRPRAEEFLIPIELDDEVAAAIAGMPSLVRLYVSSVKLSADGLRSLSQVRTLQLLSSRQLDTDQADRLREALPECEINVRP